MGILKGEAHLATTKISEAWGQPWLRDEHKNGDRTTPSASASQAEAVFKVEGAEGSQCSAGCTLKILVGPLSGAQQEWGVPN